MKTEFKTGDKVTFKPYEKECDCAVKAIKHGWCGNGKDMFQNQDDRVFYRLTGEAETLTTGKSIMESALFEPWAKEEAENFYK